MKIKLIENGQMPRYMTDGAVGADCVSRIDAIINPNETIRIPLGFCVEVPEGFELQVRPRSGLSTQGIFGILGTIDNDYRGEVSALLYNSTSKSFRVPIGMRVCQIVLCPVSKAKFEIVEELDETKRNKNGFGSTGY